MRRIVCVADAAPHGELGVWSGLLRTLTACNFGEVGRQSGTSSTVRFGPEWIFPKPATPDYLISCGGYGGTKRNQPSALPPENN